MPDLDTALRDLVERSLTPLDRDELVAARRVRRARRRLRLGTAVALVVIVGAVAGVLRFSRSNHPVRVATASTSPSTTAASDGLVAVHTSTGPSPLLAPVLALPPCADDGTFASWTRDALAPYDTTAVPPNAALDRAVDRQALIDVARDTPLLVEPHPAGCVVAGTIGRAVGWERRDASGALIARAVSIPGSGSVPDRMTSDHALYHQEWIGSGQTINGFIDGDALEAVIDRRITVMQVPGLGATTEADGLAFEARLLRADFVTSSEAPSYEQPTRVPDGFVVCTAAPRAYCDGRGDSVSVSTGGDGLPAGQHLTVNGQPAVATSSGPNQRAVTVALVPPAQTIRIDATGNVTTDELVAILESVPTLTDAYLHPQTGSGDLRAQFGAPWFREQLTAIGATDVTVTNPYGGLPGTLDARFTLGSRTAVRVLFAAQLPSPLLIPGRVERIGSVDFLVTDHQALGYCNDIFVNVMAPDAVPVASLIVHQLGC